MTRRPSRLSGTIVLILLTALGFNKPCLGQSVIAIGESLLQKPLHETALHLPVRSNASPARTLKMHIAENSNDSVTAAVNRKARNRALHSALLPGLGQIENNQIWKAPLVWGGLALSVYFIAQNHDQYQEFAKAYRLRTDNDSTTVDQFDPRESANNSPPFYSAPALRDGRETFRRNRTLSIISTAAVYLANVIDAYVFAHLQDFNVSDDLSMNIRPPRFANIAQQPGFTAGITLKLKP